MFFLVVRSVLFLWTTMYYSTVFYLYKVRMVIAFFCIKLIKSTDAGRRSHRAATR